MVRVGINGFGRIGRNFLRACLERGVEDIEIVAVNDLGSPETNAHLLTYDSTFGKLKEPVELAGQTMKVGKRQIQIFQEREPKALPWKDLGVEVVIESTGKFTSRAGASSHLEAGAERVIISAPGTEVDATFVVGVNADTYDPAKHRVVSNASCTTNCVVPMAKVLDDAFGIKTGLMTTAHAYTNDQNLLDLLHKDLRRARAAAVNIVPSTTGAARATGLVLTHLKGKLDGMSLRVPVPCGSITDLVVIVGAKVTKEEVNAAYKRASEQGPLSGGILEYSEAPLVSSDIVGSPASCTFDSQLTMVMPIDDSTSLVKVFGWYDNEWGYSNRLVDLTRIVGRA